MKKSLTILLLLVTFAMPSVQAQNYYEHFSENANSKHAKRMMKVFEDIAEKKWENANKRMAEFDEKYEKAKAKNPDDADAMLDALRPLPELARALLCLAPAMEGEEQTDKNAWTAYDKVKRVEKNRYARHIDSFLSTIEDSPLQLSEIINDIENRLYDEVKTKHTLEAYEKLLGVLRNRSLIDKKVNTEYEQLYYDGVMASGDVERCAAYLNRFTKNASTTHYNRVTTYRDSLAYAMVPPTEAGMRQYLKQYPQSTLVNEARKNLYEYAFQGLEHTEKAYKAYTIEFPNSPRLEEARDSMASCAWQTANDAGTFKAYDTYCRTYSQAKNIGEAKAVRLAAGRREFVRLSATDIPEDMRQDSIVANFLLSRKYNIYARQAYDVHDERVDTVVETIKTPKGGSVRKVYIFERDGLISCINQTQKGATQYEYGEEPGLGFYLAMTNTSDNKMVTYTPTFAPNGLLTQLTGSDGSRETFDYEEGDFAFVHSYFPKGSKAATAKRRYERGRLVEETKGTTRTTYEYNEQGDVERRVSSSGSKVLSLTSYEYTYNELGCWTECRQIGVDGSTQERKTRTYRVVEGS